ncbi:MAG: hypothetical protein GY910_04115 [bacterium]|nr:hypothetical protein [Deltaproteobacteria bacterium]MCP4904145.1 hypothetical protein [bacterium]
MDVLLELLEDPAYRHILLNHLPVTGLSIGWIVLLWATIEARWRSILFGLVLVLVASASGLLVMAAGDDAYPLVFDLLDGTGRAWLDHHTEFAGRWGFLITLNAVAAAIAIGLGSWREDLQRLGGIVVLLTTVVSLITSGMIAESGGKIRHSEFRLTDPPPVESPGRIR